LFPLYPVVLDQEPPVTLLGSGHEQCPTLYARIKLNTMITASTINTNVSRATPSAKFCNLLALAIEYRSPFIVSTSEDHSGIGPWVIMEIVCVGFEKLVQEHVEREPGAVFEQQIIAFQVRFVVHAIIHNAFTTQSVQ